MVRFHRSMVRSCCFCPFPDQLLPGVGDEERASVRAAKIAIFHERIARKARVAEEDSQYFDQVEMVAKQRRYTWLGLGNERRMDWRHGLDNMVAVLVCCKDW